MDLPNRRMSRFIFVEYIFSSYFTNNSLDQVTQSLGEELEVTKYNREKLNLIVNTYNDHINSIKNHIDELNLDNLTNALLIAAVTEYKLEDKKLVISEYLKLADLFGLNSKFINSYLDKEYNNLLKL